ncbi:MAG: cytochrome c, partial [Chloroflexi bacterium]|nr:cytochrome c [Chloroflexota bacterium]
EAFHGLTHAFYDEWVKGTEDVVGHVMPHIVYLDISANVSDLRAQVANWEKGQDSGRRIAMEKVDRLNNVIPHVAWPGVMIGSALELKDALEPVEAGLEAQNLVATTQALAKVSDAFHSLTHAFYDKWITSQRGMMAHAVVHASYQDIWLNVNDLRAQVANWEKGQDSGRRIALEKVDRLEALIPHVAWPREMKHPIDELHEGIEGAEKGLTAQDVAATKEALSMVSEAFHELTHEFYESIEPRRPAATTEMAPGMPMETMAPETAPALDPALVAQGRTLFATKGCSVCHGANGEGGIGPRLAGHFHSSDLITSIVRNGSGAMPAFAPAQISDGDLAAIVAFVQSLAQ